MTIRTSPRKTRRIHFLPTTRRGSWAVGLGGAGIVLTFGWAVVPFGAFPGFILGIAGGVLALVAIIREGERALSVFIAVLFLLFVVWFLVAEVLSAVGVLPEH